MFYLKFTIFYLKFIIFYLKFWIFYQTVYINPFKKTGIHEGCIFNSLKSFHVTLNVAVDIMHLFEGVLKNDLSLIILYFINKKVFTLEEINSRKQLFDYGPIEVGNISLPLTLDQLQTRNLKMSATESWTFLHFLPLMVGDLIPHDCPVWKFLLNLHTLMDTCLLSSFKESDLQLLNKLVKYHNKVYVELFGQHLKPKAHFLTHYVTVIKRLGPLKFLWCLRYEAKHKELKAYCKANFSRRDICYSLAVKIAMKLANRFFLNETFELISEVKENITAYNKLGQKPYYILLKWFVLFIIYFMHFWPTYFWTTSEVYEREGLLWLCTFIWQARLKDWLSIIFIFLNWLLFELWNLKLTSPVLSFCIR